MGILISQELDGSEIILKQKYANMTHEEQYNWMLDASAIELL